MPGPTSNQGAESKRWLVPLLANCAPSDVPGACKAVANDQAGAQVRAGIELASELDEEHV